MTDTPTTRFPALHNALAADRRFSSDRRLWPDIWWDTDPDATQMIPVVRDVHPRRGMQPLFEGELDLPPSHVAVDAFLDMAAAIDDHPPPASLEHEAANVALGTQSVSSIDERDPSTLKWVLDKLLSWEPDSDETDQ